MHRWRARQFGYVIRLLVSVSVLSALLLCTLFPRSFTPHDPDEQSWLYRLKPPGTVNGDGLVFVLGTDELGRDVLSRIIAGARVSLIIAVSAATLSALVGAGLGLFAAFQGGWLRGAIQRLTEVQLSLPYVLLALAIIGVLGPSIPRLIIVLTLASWPTFARVVDAEAVVLKQLPFIEAARALGVSTGQVLWRHLVPNLLPSVIVLWTFTMATAIVAEAGLSFLGLGVPPTIPSWGAMLAEGRSLLAVAWWLGTIPGLAIFLTATAFNLLGDLLRDKLDPRLKGVH